MNTKTYRNIMKNITNAIILVLTVITLLILTSGCCDERLNVIPAERPTCTIDGVVYRLLKNGDATVSDINLTPGNTYINIQSDVYIDGAWHPVRSLSFRSFDNAEFLDAITIPETIKSIAPGTFKNCTGLTIIDLTGTRCPELENEAFEEITYYKATLCYRHDMLICGNWRNFINQRTF